MILVAPVCRTCGAKTEQLAVIMDPFLDSCYGVCRTCLDHLHARYMGQLSASLSASIRTLEDSS